VPPRYLKSLLASVAFPAWCLGRQPGTQILCVSYAQDLADKLARDCRRIVMSGWYQRAFPTRLSAQRQAVPEFETTRQGCRLATSVGGVLTGRGADIIIIDDPLKPEEALSQTQRQAVNEWFDHTLYSRLNDKQKGAIVLIMHRLHEDDLVGHVLAQEDWEVVRFPAIAEEDEVHPVETVWGPRHFTRRRGEALHPEREPTAMLERIRRTIGEYNFAGQYQQAPSPLGGGLVKAAWFRYYAPGELPESFERIVQNWDTASKATELSDFSVCTTWGIADKGLYLLDVLRRRMEYPELKRAVREQHERFGPSVVLIEDKASGIQLIQELIREGLHAVTRYQPQSDKIMRMHAQTAMIENGFVRVPDAAPWLKQYLHELTVFPNGKHDDQVDSTRRCSTGSNDPTAPPPTPGSSSFTGSAPRNSEGRCCVLRRACAAHAASRACSCFQASAGTWPPTARSRCQKQMPRRCCGPGGCGSTWGTPPQRGAVRSDHTGERIVTVRLTSPPKEAAHPTDRCSRARNVRHLIRA
jgi:predicted phage terminase large subunit-like protein